MNKRFEIGMHPLYHDIPGVLWFDGDIIARFAVQDRVAQYGPSVARDYINRFIALLTNEMPDTAAYAPGNQASKEAAKKIRGKLTGIRARVHDFISIQGSRGATGSEISEALDILPYTAKPRCSELRDAGLIVDSGMMRENKNGGKETVWVLAVDNPHQRGDNPSTL